MRAESEAKARAIIPSDRVLAKRQRRADEWTRNFSALTIEYDPKRDDFSLKMISGIQLRIPRVIIREFNGAPPETLEKVVVGTGGDSIESAVLDVHIFLPGLVRDLFGLNLGQRIGGHTKSPAKAKAARQNGRLGGRPKTATKPH